MDFELDESLAAYYADENITPFTLSTPLFGKVHLPSHKLQDCAGEYCPMHHPSDHPMATWPLHWRTDKAIFERICRHRRGHPDPDCMAYLVRTKESGEVKVKGIHGCCHCCSTKEKKND